MQPYAYEYAFDIHIPYMYIMTIMLYCIAYISPASPVADYRLWVLGVVLGSLGGAAVIVWAVLFVYFRCVRPLPAEREGDWDADHILVPPGSAMRYYQEADARKAAQAAAATPMQSVTPMQSATPTVTASTTTLVPPEGASEKRVAERVAEQLQPTLEQSQRAIEKRLRRIEREQRDERPVRRRAAKRSDLSERPESPSQNGMKRIVTVTEYPEDLASSGEFFFSLLILFMFTFSDRPALFRIVS